MNKKIIEKLLLVFVLLIAFFGRLWAVFNYGDFWDDEMFNFIYSQKSWTESLKLWIWETNPPLHLLILKLWFYLFPANEMWARIPSVLAGTASVYYTYILAKSFWGKSVANIASLFMAVQSYVIFWSATARIYSFLILFSTASIFYFWEIFFTENKTTKNKILFLFAHLLLIFSHLTSIFIIITELMILYIFQKQKIKEWLKLIFIPMLIGGSWIAYSMFIKMGNHLEQSWFLNIHHSINSALVPLFNITFGLNKTLPGLLLLVMVIFLVYNTLDKEKNNLNKPLLISLILSITSAIFSFILGVWHIKFFIISLPFILLTIAYCLQKLFSPTASLFIIFILCLPGLFNLKELLPLTDWKEIEQIITEKRQTEKKEVVLSNNFILKTQFDRYLNGLEMPKIVLDINPDNLTWDEMVFKKNYLFIRYDEQINDWLEEKNINSYERIYLVQGEYTFMHKLNDALTQAGWRLESWPKKLRLSGEYWLYTYKK